MALTAKMRRFCEEYLKDLNGTQAAIRAGYSKNTACVIANENLRKPDIRDFIDKRLKELTITADETTKMISDIAKTDLSKYFVLKKNVTAPKVKVGLKQIIKDIKLEIAIEDEFAATAKLSNGTLKAHKAQQEARRHRILKLQIELKHNPKAYRIMDGEPQLVETAELDLVALVRDNEAGKIKSVTPTEHGYKVEMYAADAALLNIARMHGLYEKDNSQSRQTPAAQLSDDQFDKLLNTARETKTNSGQ